MFSWILNIQSNIEVSTDENCFVKHFLHPVYRLFNITPWCPINNCQLPGSSTFCPVTGLLCFADPHESRISFQFKVRPFFHVDPCFRYHSAWLCKLRQVILHFLQHLQRQRKNWRRCYSGLLYHVLEILETAQYTVYCTVFLNAVVTLAFEPKKYLFFRLPFSAFCMGRVLTSSTSTRILFCCSLTAETSSLRQSSDFFHMSSTSSADGVFSGPILFEYAKCFLAAC